MQNGVCKYCEQIYAIDSERELTTEEADREAALRCTCKEARKLQKIEKSRSKASENIKHLFEEHHPGAARLMQAACELIAQEEITGMSVDTGGPITGSVKLTSKGTIKVERTEKKRWTIEE